MSKKKDEKRKKKAFKKYGIYCLVIVILVAVIGLVVFLTSGKSNKNNKKLDVPESKTQTTTTKAPEKKVKIVDLESNSRPIAVMVNNISTVWGYQSGLQDAYIVYELLVEGGITRLMAVFKDANTARIGSVRSARHYYLDYVLENDALYVHVGGSPQAKKELRSLGITDFETFWRDKSLHLSTEHTAFTSIEKVKEAAKKRKVRTTSDKKTLLNYSVDELDLSTLDGAIPCEQLYLSYSNSKSTTFKYDKENKVYLRWQNKKEHVDYVTKKQYYAKNIITYQIKSSTISGDHKGRQNMDNIGNGTGYYISNGYAVPITWEKKDRKSQTIYKLKDGSELKVNDGITFIQIQPKNREIKIS